MATTGAVVYLGLKSEADTLAHRVSGAVVPLTMRALTGLFASGVTPAADLTNLRALLPHINVDFLNGTKVSPPWYRFFQQFFDRFLAGAGTYTFEDVINAIDDAVAQSAQQSQRTEAIAQQSQANAEALSAAVQVVQNNGLSGAEQIPPVRLTNQEMIP